MSYCDIVIYTDGSCFSNGLPKARAGYGVYCPDDQRLNFAGRLGGRQTNQRAEIMGARCGILRAEKFGYSSVLVKLDSQYVVKGIEEWLPSWERSNSYRKIANLQDFYDLKSAMDGIDVELEWISRWDNEEADSLARRGAMLPVGHGENVYL